MHYLFFIIVSELMLGELSTEILAMPYFKIIRSSQVWWYTLKS